MYFFSSRAPKQGIRVGRCQVTPTGVGVRTDDGAKDAPLGDNGDPPLLKLGFDERLGSIGAGVGLDEDESHIGRWRVLLRTPTGVSLRRTISTHSIMLAQQARNVRHTPSA